MDSLREGTALAAEVMNCAWWVRHYPRAHQGALRRQAIIKMAATVRAALDSGDPEAVLYAVAVGLYTPDDPRFRP